MGTLDECLNIILFLIEQLFRRECAMSKCEINTFLIFDLILKCEITFLNIYQKL